MRNLPLRLPPCRRSSGGPPSSVPREVQHSDDVATEAEADIPRKLTILLVSLLPYALPGQVAEVLAGGLAALRELQHADFLFVM